MHIPCLKRLKKKYPSASIHVLVFKQNAEILDLLNVIPLENIYTVRNISLATIIFDSIRVLKNIRQLKIDTVIDCELFSRIGSIYSFLSGAKIRAGFHPYTQEGLYRGSYINRPVLYNPYHHISRQYINLLEAIEKDHYPTVKRDSGADNLDLPLLKINNADNRYFRKRFESDFPHMDLKKTILLYPGGGLLPIRAWPIEHYCIVAEGLLHKGYGIGIIGMREDQIIADQIIAYCHNKHCVDLTGYTRTVKELMILFQIVPLLITNDGGPVHFASLTPVSTITLYGPETPVLYRPLTPNAFVFYQSLSCSPCLTAYNHRNSPCDGNNLCLKQILPGEVLSKAYEILKKN